MRTCIFCLNEKDAHDFNKEHVFPEAIGGSLTVNNVCKACNSTLGSRVDSVLANHKIIQMKRQTLGIPGKTGVPDIFRGANLMFEDKKVHFSPGVDGPTSKLRIVPDVKTKSLPGNQGVSISITLDAKDAHKLPGEVNKILRRKGLPEVDPQEIMNHATPFQVEAPEIQTSIQIPLRGHEPAILKIMYELAVMWLGPDYLTDPTGTRIRAAILDFEVDEHWPMRHRLQGDIRLAVPDPILDKLFPENSHAGFLYSKGNDISAYVRIFDVFVGQIVLSKRADTYPSFEDIPVVVLDSMSRSFERTTLGAIVYKHSTPYA